MEFEDELPVAQDQTSETYDSPSSTYATQDSRPATPQSQESLYNLGDDYYQPPTFWYPKIRALSKTLWPEARSESVFLAKGEYSKVFMISVFRDAGAEYDEYVLRLPEVEETLPNTVGVLQYLNRRIAENAESLVALKVPELVRWDCTKRNELEYPYVLLERMPGTNLQSCWVNMTHDQKVGVAKQVGQLYEEFTNIVSPLVGTFGVAPNPKTPEKSQLLDPEKILSIAALGSRFLNGGLTRTESDDAKNVLLPIDRLHSDLPGLAASETIFAPFKRRIHQLLTTYSSNPELAENCFNPLLEIIQDLEESGVFNNDDNNGDKNSNFCLWHTDLRPSHIMVDNTNGEVPCITGILDWEEPLFGPRFMAAKAPRWLWRDDAVYAEWTESRRQHDLEPLDKTDVEADGPENEEVKKVFDAVMGPEWCRMAYGTEYVVARRILDLSVLEGWATYHTYDLENLRSTWDEYCEKARVGTKEHELKRALEQLNLADVQTAPYLIGQSDFPQPKLRGSAIIPMTDSEPETACQYMRVACAATGCASDAIHAIVKRRCTQPAHSSACHRNFRGIMLASNMRYRLQTVRALASVAGQGCNAGLPKSSDRGNPETADNMKVFCAEHVSSHPALPGWRKGKDLECFTDFWLDFAVNSLKSGILDPSLHDDLAYNPRVTSRSQEQVDKHGDGDVDTAYLVNGEEPAAEVSKMDGVEQISFPEKPDVNQFKYLFPEYADLLIKHGIAFVDPHTDDG
ncbi:hypothetical protein SUNI508_00538 [Seiridium unicorne]|uniref:Aminoglycoside phosphotransferase domain-containing protein n=1 Tax=Seiridium unicorne TaxID=138068 RepID=A0ABR2V6Z0_9PEZI